MPLTYRWCVPFCCPSGSDSESGSSGSEDTGPPESQRCCFGSEDVGEIPSQLTATLESGCAAINGATITLNRGTGLIWSNGTPANIAGCLIGLTIVFKCELDSEDPSVPPDGCGQYKIVADTSSGPGCELHINKRPDTCSCDPFEFTFDGVISENALFPGTCVCCPVGAPVT